MFCDGLKSTLRSDIRSQPLESDCVQAWLLANLDSVLDWLICWRYFLLAVHCSILGMSEESEKPEFSLDDVFDWVIRFLTGKFPYCPEAIAFGMAIQGAMAVRKGPNKDGKLHWFHSFVLSTLAAFAGGTFNFIWMGQPSGILTNDVFMAVSIISFIIVNYTPADVGFAILNTTPFSIATVSFAQLFRSLGTIKFLTSCYETLKGSPSAYYPIPVFGPILYGILLGNMGPLVLKGLEAHVGNGVPWAVQNGTCRKLSVLRSACGTNHLYLTLQNSVH